MVATYEVSKIRTLCKTQDARPLLVEQSHSSENTVPAFTAPQGLTLPPETHHPRYPQLFKFPFSHSYHNSESHVLEGFCSTDPAFPSLHSSSLELLLFTLATVKAAIDDSLNVQTRKINISTELRRDAVYPNVHPC